MLIDNNKCFACGNDNPDGLKLKFIYSPDGKKVKTTFVPDAKYQGWKDVVHGGIIVTLLDETMAKAAVKKGFRILTGEISAKFKAPAKVNEQLCCEAEIEAVKKKILYVRATVYKENGSTVASATTKMFITSGSEMQIIRGSKKIKEYDLTNPVITLGNFDGVHLGHQKILKKTIQRARAVNGVSAVYTFDPHPLSVLNPGHEPLKLTTFEEKASILEEFGINYLICENFTKKFSEKSPEEFIKKIICDRIHPREIVIGNDYAFGKNRKGAVELLKKMGRVFDFQVHVASDMRMKNIPVRSTTIRNLISSGKVSLAQKLMGRHYSMTGKVIHGRKRKIGFPTANLKPYSRDLIPADGVYAASISTSYGMFSGVVNIGMNPTFDEKKTTIEVHIFDFSKNIYGEEITLFFVKRIRGEKKFKEAKTLAEQIRTDIVFAKKILK